VINRRLIGDYVKRWQEFEFLPGVPTALAQLRQRFGRMVVVTNQQGIYKGLMTEGDLQAIHRRMRSELEAAGAQLDAIYYCPASDADDPTDCRKPRLGMVRQAQRDFASLDLGRSLMVGDSITDLQLGRAAGMYTAWVGESLPPAQTHYADLQLEGLTQLAEWLE